MRKSLLTLCVVAGVALFTVSSAFSQALNPYPKRESKVLADFESAVTVMSDPLGTGQNQASVSTDAQFAAEGKNSLKVNLKDVTGWNGSGFTITFASPVDIKGYQVLSMDVFIPEDSISSSWYQFAPRVTSDAGESAYGPGNMHSGWNHLIWSLLNGTDTKVSQINVALNSGAEYTGPVYVDNIRVYKGNFLGVQPDEKLIFGFDKPSDKDLFTAVADDVKVAANSDKQFVTGGDGSLTLDLSKKASGWTNNVARVDDWGKTIDASKATAIHIDVFLPQGSSSDSTWHEIGFGVAGDGGDVSAPTNFVPLGQWATLEIPLTSEQAAMLTNIKGVFFLTNSGADWTGPMYVDSLRAVFPQ